MTIKRLIPAAILALALPGVAHAQSFTLNLLAPDQVGTPGSPTIYRGTLTNNTGSTLDLQAGSFSGFSGPGTEDLSLSDFTFSSPPVTLANNASTTLDLFSVTLNAGASPTALVNATFNYSAQMDSMGIPVGNFITTSDVALTLRSAPAVPEASSLVSLGLLLTLGMGGMALATRRKKDSRAHDFVPDNMTE